MTDDAIESYEHAGQRVEIYPDLDPMSPRDYDTMATLVCWHQRYTELGDEQVNDERFRNIKHIARYLRIIRHAVVLLPLRLLDHSGLYLDIGSGESPYDPGGWDSGQVGFAYVSREKIEEEYKEVTPETIAQAEEVLRGEVSEYADYVSGYCYGYVIHPADARVEEESCWGFIGTESIKAEANAAAERIEEQIAALPPSPYEVIVREVSTGKCTTVVGDAQAAIDSWDDQTVTAGFFQRQIEQGITEIKAGISQEE